MAAVSPKRLTFAHITVTSFGGTSAASILWPTACCGSTSAPARLALQPERCRLKITLIGLGSAAVWGTIIGAVLISA
jgi:hypothetical protein